MCILTDIIMRDQRGDGRKEERIFLNISEHVRHPRVILKDTYKGMTYSAIEYYSCTYAYIQIPENINMYDALRIIERMDKTEVNFITTKESGNCYPGSMINDPEKTYIRSQMFIFGHPSLTTEDVEKMCRKQIDEIEILRK